MANALIACWVAFPLLLALLAYGCGAFVERLAGRALPLCVLLPCGMTLTIGVLDLLTRSTSTVSLAIPAVCALAAGGLVLRPPWRWRRLDRALLPAVVVFAVYAAPIVLSGTATWAGYVKLDDTATWLALVDRTLAAGHTLSGLAPSTYMDTLAAYLVNGYPVGSFLPLGLGHGFLGEDIAWLTDPWMAFMAGMLALSLYRIATLALGERVPRWQPTAIAILAAQPALLYGYYLWGGMKEMAGAMLVAAFASTVALIWESEPRKDEPPEHRPREDDPKETEPKEDRPKEDRPIPSTARRLRAAIPALVVVWALISALSSGGLVWLLPGGASALAVLSLRRGMRLPSLRVVLAAVAVCGVGAYVALRPGGFIEQYKSVFTGSTELGNLLRPLRLRQIAGIWPSGDFRVLPAHLIVSDLLIALALLIGAGGLLAAVRRAHRGFVLYVLCSLTGALLVFWIGSPWLAGKALATASPAVAFAALAGCAMLVAHGRRALGLLAGTAIAGGIAWSNVLGYHAVRLAPREQFAELADIGQRIAGEGPTLMTEYSPFGARHFLREAEPESASDLRSRLDPLRSGQPLPKGGAADVDQFQLSALLVYRTLVLRRSPTASRPPSPFALVLRDRFWEVWQRPAQVSPLVLAQLPLGDTLQPAGVPSCTAVNRLARTPGAQILVAAPAENPVVVPVGEAAAPKRWSDNREHLTLAGAGTARILVAVPHAGRYEIWLGGSMSGPVTVAVNGVEIGTARYEVQEDGQYVPFGSIGLEAGRYRVSVSYDGGDWRPGSGGMPATVGPLVLQPEAPQPQLMTVPLRAARSLCGRTLDWIEALGA
jgi:hypothetical protein